MSSPPAPLRSHHSSSVSLPPADPAAMLGTIGCLATLNGEALARLARDCRFMTYAAGDIVGGPASGEASVALVASGRVRVSRPADRHGDIAFHDVPQGQVFGHLEALAGQTPRLYAVALSHVQLAIMSASAFLALLEEHPRIALTLLRAQALDVVASLPRSPAHTGSGAHRLYAELLEMAEADPQAAGRLVIARLPRHRELAGWTGLDESDVAAALAGLVRNGCVERRYPGLVILDAESLQRLATP